MTPTSEAMSDVREYLAAKHTPGPWCLDAGLPGGVYSNDATGSIVARCMGVGFEFVCRRGEESKANARLIAAAPDMLAALREIEEMADDRADVDDGIPNEAMRMLVIVRDAIRKAEGRS